MTESRAGIRGDFRGQSAYLHIHTGICIECKSGEQWVLLLQHLRSKGILFSWSMPNLSQPGQDSNPHTELDPFTTRPGSQSGLYLYFSFYIFKLYLILMRGRFDHHSHICLAADELGFEWTWWGETRCCCYSSDLLKMENSRQSSIHSKVGWEPRTRHQPSRKNTHTL